jgi:DNA-binding ferritin-like protein (Dps family)
MTMGISDFTSKLVGDKKRWHKYKARAKALPDGYRTAVDGIERYLMHFGVLDADDAASLFEDVIDLFEQAAADGTPIRGVVGDHPVEFVEAMIRNYDKGGYVAREQARLVETIHRAEAEAASTLPT